MAMARMRLPAPVTDLEIPLRHPALVVFASLAPLLASGCSSVEAWNDNRVTVLEQSFGKAEQVANIGLVAPPGSTYGGRVSFSQYGRIVLVRADLTGLQPNREYGLHVHEHGDCLGATATGIGGHFNPDGKPHGRPGSDASHAGDLMNLRADGEGYVMSVFQTTAISLTPGPRSVIGRSIVLSRDPDDYKTQPDGNSGPPIACGFIRRTD
jgi:Cu-Zn family superoxide dismutase